MSKAVLYFFFLSPPDERLSTIGLYTTAVCHSSKQTSLWGSSSPPPHPPPLPVHQSHLLDWTNTPTDPESAALSRPSHRFLSMKWRKGKSEASVYTPFFFFFFCLLWAYSCPKYFSFLFFLSNELYLLWKKKEKKKESIGSLLHHCTALRSLAPAAAEARKKGGLRSGAQLCCSVLDSIGGAESYSVSVSWVGSPANVQGFDNVPAPQSQKNLQGEREESGVEWDSTTVAGRKRNAFAAKYDQWKRQNSGDSLESVHIVQVDSYQRLLWS